MIFPLAIALLAADPFSTCRLHEPATQAGLIIAEQRWVAALESRNVAALQCRLASGFVDTGWRGELVTRDTVIAALPNRPPSRLVLSDVTAEVHGRIGIIRGTNTQTHLDGTAIGKVRFTDVFVRHHGMWQALSAQETLVQ